MDGHYTHDTFSIPSLSELDNKDGIGSPKDKRYYPKRCSECKLCADIYHGYHNAMGASGWINKSLWDAVLKLDLRHDPETHITAPAKTTHTGNGTHQGWFAGTLTQSVDDDSTEDQMITAMEKIFSQQTCPVDKYAWYLEYTKKQVPHIHFIYITSAGGRIHAKIFKRYWKQWDEKRRLGKGHQGGYHAPVFSDVAYREYIAKDSGKHATNFSLEDV